MILLLEHVLFPSSCARLTLDKMEACTNFFEKQNRTPFFISDMKTLTCNEQYKNTEMYNEIYQWFFTFVWI